MGLLAAVWPLSLSVFACVVAALVVAWIQYVDLWSRSDGDERTRAAAHVLHETGLAERKAEVRRLAIVVAVVLVLLLTFAREGGDRWNAWGFVLGAAVAALARLFAWRNAAAAHGRVVEAARASSGQASAAAEMSGAVVGFGAAAVGLLVVHQLWMHSDGPQVLWGLALGVVGVEFLARGPAGTLALPVVTLVGAVAAGAGLSRGADPAALPAPGLAALPFALVGGGLVAGIVGRRGLALERGDDVAVALRRTALVASACFAGASLLLIALVDRAPLRALGERTGMASWGSYAGLVVAMVAGSAAAFTIGRTAQFFAPPERGAGGPVSPGPTVLPMVLLAAALLAAWEGAGPYGIAIAAAGMVATQPLIRSLDQAATVTAGALELVRTVVRTAGAGAAMDAGVGRHLAESARGVSEAQRAGHATTSAVAALATLVLLLSGALPFAPDSLALGNPKVIAGLLVGVAIPFGLARAARRGMILPVLVAVGAPLALGRLHELALGGMLVGVLAAGLALALFRGGGEPTTATGDNVIDAWNDSGAATARSKLGLLPILMTLVAIVAMPVE